MMRIPNSFFLTNGIGVHRERLTAFELALRDADIEQQNLVSISSIAPPSCSEVERQKGAEMVMFEESGHCPMWEEPEKFNQVVGDWIAAL